MPPQGSRPGNTQGRRTLNSIDIENDIIRLSNDIDELLTTLDEQAREWAEADHAWEMHRAYEGLKAQAEPGNGPSGRTTVDEREARVMTREPGPTLHLEAQLAERLYNVTKEQIHAKRDQMRALQTISANIRAVTTGGGA